VPSSAGHRPRAAAARWLLEVGHDTWLEIPHYLSQPAHLEIISPDLAARTPFMNFGGRVRMEGWRREQPVFGAIDQHVVHRPIIELRFVPNVGPRWLCVAEFFDIRAGGALRSATCRAWNVSR
jgi:hypothetical protein